MNAFITADERRADREAQLRDALRMTSSGGPTAAHRAEARPVQCRDGMRGTRFSLLLPAVLAVLPLQACSGADDGSSSGEEGAVDESEEALTARVFRRTDQASFQRTPDNTVLLHELVADDFSDAPAAAARIIDWVHKHPGDPRPAYLGNLQTWIFDSDASYRANVRLLVTLVAQATHHPMLLYFEERNATHLDHPIAAVHGEALRAVAKGALLLCATYITGVDSRATVRAKIEHYRAHYRGQLAIPLSSMIIDVDTSQTPANAYYGTRGDLAGFDDNIALALRTAYEMKFGGFHSIGNSGGHFGTKRAADATYTRLDAAWNALSRAHPTQKFAGL